MSRRIFSSARSREAKLAVNTAALTVGRLGSKLLVFLLIRFYTYVLTKEQYGTADLITNAANLIIPLACAGLSSGFFRFAAEAKSRREQTAVFSTGVCILALSSMVFALFSPLLFFVPYFSDYVFLIIAYVLCANLHYFVSDFIRARGHYRLYAIQGIFNTFLNIVLNLIFLLPLSMGVNGYVLSVIVADLITSILLIILCRLWRFLKMGVADAKRIRIMLRYCLPLIPATLCWWITNVSDRYMVTYFCGEAANGVYAAAYKIPNLLAVICGVFADAWQFSAVSEYRKLQDSRSSEEMQEQSAALSDFFSKAFKGYAGFLFLATAGMILICRPMARILFDPSFADAWQFVPVLVLATSLSALGNFSASTYMVKQRSMPTLVTSLIGAVTNVALNLILIPAYGPMGAAVATAACYLIVFALRLYSSRKFVRYKAFPVWLTFNLLLLFAMSAILTMRLNGWIWICAVLFVLVAAINLLPLLHSIRSYLQKRALSGEKLTEREKSPKKAKKL